MSVGKAAFQTGAGASVEGQAAFAHRRACRDRCGYRRWPLLPHFLCRSPSWAPELRGHLMSLFCAWGARRDAESNPNYKSAGSVASAPSGESPAATSGTGRATTERSTSERYLARSARSTRRMSTSSRFYAPTTPAIHSFETGLIMVDGALIGTTEFDIFSHRPRHLHRELAHARGLSGLASAGQSRRRLPRRYAVSGRPKTEECWLMTSRPASGFGRRRSRTRKTARRACGPDRLGRPRLHRQCRRRFQGRQGAHVSRSTQRPARSSGNSSSCPRPRATRSAGR